MPRDQIILRAAVNLASRAVQATGISKPNSENLTRYQRFPIGEVVLKRVFDVIVSSILVVSLLPILAAIALAVKISSPGPIFFLQTRIGRNCIPFRIMKFRTMLVDSEKLGKETAGTSDVRITVLGRFLRRYKLDELPQLLNVLKGDMSMVGPRPEIPFYAERYRGDERMVFSVQPGITDNCSLEFSNLEETMDRRGNLTPAQYYETVILPRKKAIQMKYVRERTFAMDLVILYRTFLRVVMRGK